MGNLLQYLWVIPALPLAAAAVSALLAGRGPRALAPTLAVGSMVVAFFLSVGAFSTTLAAHGEAVHQYHNFPWFSLGESTFRLGWILDPLSAAMLVMITFVGTLIFIFSIGYMAHDPNFGRFFCFLALFAAAMLGLVIANNLLLLFMCWEVVGLASYLLIGFWFHKPSAAAAAKKAFITTRIGDVFFFLGLLWLNAETGTLLFYDNGAGCLEHSAVSALVGQGTLIGMGLSTAISLLIFCGAIGKSGQLPLHVWLPDAMEGPTPVSALIHAATMVAAGVFLVARVYPLMSAVPVTAGVAVPPVPPAIEAKAEAAKPEGAKGESVAGAVAAKAEGGQKAEAKTTATAKSEPVNANEGEEGTGPVSFALQVVTWVGALTALYAALVAVAQTDIKRILAYSTVSQLGFMFIGLGAGGVAVGMFHLLTHAFFKALLFLGSGSVIHGCHEEQDVRRMGGLRRQMPVTFYTYAIGMMALSGVPFFFSGFYSKDEILHAAALWAPSKWPFLIGLLGAFLTAFYMTRQMWYVFFGQSRASQVSTEAIGAVSDQGSDAHGQAHDNDPGHGPDHGAHESPPSMTGPLRVLAACTILLVIFGTPVWPWFHSYLSGHGGHPSFSPLIRIDTLGVMAASGVIACGGIWLGWRLYSRRGPKRADELDPLEVWKPDWFAALRGKLYFDELYELSVIRFNAWAARMARRLDDVVWDSAVMAVTYLVVGFSWVNKFFDEFAVNLGFDRVCGAVRNSGDWVSFFQNGKVQRYLRVLGIALVVFGVFFLWGGRR